MDIQKLAKRGHGLIVGTASPTDETAKAIMAFIHLPVIEPAEFVVRLSEGFGVVESLLDRMVIG